MLNPGTILIERYRIEKRISCSYRSNIYSAYDQQLGDRLVAVKELLVRLDHEEREPGLEKLKQELIRLTAVKTTSIVPFYDYFYLKDNAVIDNKTFDGCYLVMKYLTRGSLAQRGEALTELALSERTVVSWAIQLCDIINCLNSQDPVIFFQDFVQLQHIMFDEQDQIVLIDFNLVKFLTPRKTSDHPHPGSGFIAPETYVNKLSPQSDIYSIGAIMFYFLTNRDPRENPELTFDFQRNPKPRQLNSALTEEIERIICQAVEAKPRNRFTSIVEMKQSLADHLVNLANRPEKLPPEPDNKAEPADEVVRVYLVIDEKTDDSAGGNRAIEWINSIQNGIERIWSQSAAQLQPATKKIDRQRYIDFDFNKELAAAKRLLNSQIEFKQERCAISANGGFNLMRASDGILIESYGQEYPPEETGQLLEHVLKGYQLITRKAQFDKNGKQTGERIVVAKLFPDGNYRAAILTLQGSYASSIYAKSLPHLLAFLEKNNNGWH